MKRYILAAIILLVALLSAACADPIQPTPEPTDPVLPTPLPYDEIRQKVAEFCGFTGEKELTVVDPNGVNQTVRRWEIWHQLPLQEDPLPDDEFEAHMCKVGFTHEVRRPPEGVEGNWEIGLSAEAGLWVTIYGHFWFVEDPGSDNQSFQGEDAEKFMADNGLNWLLPFLKQTSLMRFELNRQTGEINSLPPLLLLP